jgi:hypothetical protein
VARYILSAMSMKRKYVIHQNREHPCFCVLCISSSDCIFHFYTIFLWISGGQGLSLSNGSNKSGSFSHLYITKLVLKTCWYRKASDKGQYWSKIAGSSPWSYKVILHVVLKTSTPTVTMKPCDELHTVSDLILAWLCARTLSSGLMSRKFPI